MNSPVLLSSDELNDLMSQLDLISEGEYSVVGRVLWQGSPAILKVMKNYAEVNFKRELYILDRLQGEAGGAPCLLAVCHDPPSFVMSSRGQETLHHVLRTEKHDWYLIYIILRLGVRLRELHRRGVIHGDIHGGNIMVSLSSPRSHLPEVFIIDFGLSSLSQEALSTVEDPVTQDMLDTAMTYKKDLTFFEKVLKHVLYIVNVQTDTTDELLTWLRANGVTLFDDILRKLYAVLTKDLRINLVDAPDYNFLISPISAEAEAANSPISWDLVRMKGLQRMAMKHRLIS